MHFQESFTGKERQREVRKGQRQKEFENDRETPKESQRGTDRQTEI